MTTPHSEPRREAALSKSSLPLPPGSFGLPIIGETISFLRDSNFADKRHKQYGPVFKTHLFGRPTVMMLGAEANRFLLTSENQYFTISWPYSTKVLLGSASLAVQIGGEHIKRRKLLAQAFQPRALAGYVTQMESITRRYLNKWESLGTLTWYPELRKYTFDVACSLLIGTDSGSDSHFGDLFEEWCKGLFTIPLRMPWTKFSRALRCREKLLAKIEEIVKDRQQQPSSGEDALGILLQARDKLFAALLVRDYHWELLPDQNLEMVRVPTPHPRDALRVNFQRVSKKNTGVQEFRSSGVQDSPEP